MLMNAQSLGKDYTFTKPYACIYTLVYIHTSYTLTHIWIHNHSRDYIRQYKYLCQHTQAFIITHAFTRTRAFTRTQVHTCTYAYTHSRKRSYAYICANTYTYIQNRNVCADTVRKHTLTKKHKLSVFHALRLILKATRTGPTYKPG